MKLPIVDPVIATEVVSTDTVTDPILVPEPVISEPDPTVAEVPPEASTTDPLPEPEPAPVDEEVPADTSTTTEETLNAEPEVIDEGVIEEGVAEVSPTTPFVMQAHNDSEMVFDNTECVSVQDGAYYCTKKSVSTENTARPMQRAEVFVAKDGDGDTEIYFQNDGQTRKISDNVYDDDAPMYDPTSGRIVWHGNVNDRYQIFVYDPADETVHQITHDGYNNTNPYIDGGVLVWQAWVDENWEIMSVNVGAGYDALEVTRLSGSGNPDMFPKVYGDFVTWQSRVNDAWRSVGLNIQTGEQTDLGAGTQGDVSAARLVLLVERRNENGDVERVGYDVDSGDEIELGTKEKDQVPVEVPLPSPYQDPSAIPAPVVSTTTAPVRNDTGDEPIL